MTYPGAPTLSIAVGVVFPSLLETRLALTETVAPKRDPDRLLAPLLWVESALLLPRELLGDGAELKMPLPPPTSHGDIKEATTLPP
jgi:hypothetical protein